MRRAIQLSVILLIIIFLMPLLLIPSASHPQENPKAAPEPDKPGRTDREPSPSASQDLDDLSVRLLLDEQVITLSLRDYLHGVLSAEVPASFEPEALKAQAVAARTYAVYKLRGTPPEHHRGADLCADFGCCQAYRTPEASAALWGDSSEAYAARIAAAVSQTAGMVILYQEEPILAAFHSSSNGRTEDAEDAWSSPVPYLRSVSSPENEDTVTNYVTVQSVSVSEFAGTIRSRYPDAKLDGRPSAWFGNEVRSKTGRVLSIEIGGVPIPGAALRSLFSLRSTAFQVTASDTEITFSVTGYGHGVGMSQYGANAMAKAGRSFQEIVEWYYTGATVRSCTLSELFPELASAGR